MKYLSMFLLLVVGGVAYAESTAIHQVSRLKAQENGIVVKLKDFTGATIAGSCSNSDTFFMPISEGANYKERVSFLLTAYTAKLPILITYYECVSGLIKVGSIQFD